MGIYFMTRHIALPTNNTSGEVTNIHTNTSAYNTMMPIVAGFEPLNTGSLVDSITTDSSLSTVK
jgi:hypothetical protein